MELIFLKKGSGSYSEWVGCARGIWCVIVTVCYCLCLKEFSSNVYELILYNKYKVHV